MGSHKSWIETIGAVIMDLMSSEHIYESDVTHVKLCQLIHVIYYCQT